MLIELVLRLQRPEKTSRTSSKPSAMDRKKQREQSKPDSARPGHEGHSRVLSDDLDTIVEPSSWGLRVLRQQPARRSSSGGRQRLRADQLPTKAPIVTQHRQIAVRCPTCKTRVVVPVPKAAQGTPFGPRLHAVPTYLKTFQVLSYERLQAALSNLFGLNLSQGGLMNLLRRAQGRFHPGRDAAVSALRKATVVACDKTGRRIEGSNAYPWLFHSAEAVVHTASPTRVATVVREMMDSHTAGRVDLGSLHRSTGPRRRAPNLPGASGTRRRLCRRGQRRSRALASAALAADRVRLG